MASSKTSTPSVIYTPPASERIEQFGEQVCYDLGEDFFDPEIIEGLTEFLKVAVWIILGYLNRGQFDNDEE